MTTEELRFVLKAKDEASSVVRGVKNEMSGMSKSLGSLGKVAKVAAAVGIAALIAGVTALITLGINAKQTYEKWMQTLDDFQDVTGLTAKSVSLIAAQARLADVDVGKLSKGVFIFTKNLDAARGGGAQAGIFKQLGVDVKNLDGSLRPLNDVLLEARDRLSEVDDQTTRNALAAKLFGRGAKDMADWLAKSSKEMQAYAKFAKDLGMVMGEKSMKNFQDYRENQRKIAFAWDAIKINAYGALVPLINDLMPKIIKLISRGASWTARFRQLVEKKGWEAAIRQMVPWLSNVIDKVRQAKAWWDRNKESIKGAASAAGRLFVKIVELVNWVSNNGSALATAMYPFYSRMLAIASLVGSIISKLLEISRWQPPNFSVGGGGGGGGGKGGGGAHGGIFDGPGSGYYTLMHGREAIVPLSPSKRGDAARVMGEAGLLGGAGQAVKQFIFNGDITFSGMDPEDFIAWAEAQGARMARGV